MKLSEKLKYPFKREPKIRHSIYGILMSIGYFLAIGIPIYLGYMHKIIINRASGDCIKTPPSYRPFLQLVKNGFGMVSTIICSFGLPLIGIIAVNSIVEQGPTISGTTSASLLGLIISTLFIMSIVGIFIWPSLIMNYVKSGKWYYIFSFDTIWYNIKNKSYYILLTKIIGFSVIVGLITQFIVSTIILIPVAGVLWFMYCGYIGIIIGDYLNTEDIINDKN